MEVCTVKHQIQENESISNMIRENTQILYSNVDYHCLRLYDETNEHFSMAIIIENREDEQEQAVGYNCIYRYEIHRIKLEFDIKNGLWKFSPIQFEGEHFDLSPTIFENIQFLTLDEQIQIIIQRLNQYFTDLNIQTNKNNLIQAPISATIFKEDHLIKYPTHELIEMNTQQIPKSSLAIPEDDDIIKDSIDYGFHEFLTGSRNNKFSGLAPPPVAPRRSRQNSACSTQSSVRYASFMPPPSAPVRRRRVIESIVLYVQRKKKPFEKIVDLVRGIESPTMYDLGLEFLRVYDGKFNFREGHTFVMSFRKKTWFLTIEQINCVDCAVGEIGPRSLLKLNYKGQIATINHIHHHLNSQQHVSANMPDNLLLACFVAFCGDDNTLQQQLDNVNAVVHQLQQQLQETQQQLQQTQQQLQQTQQQLQQTQQQLQQGHQQINQLLQQPVQQSSSNEDGSVPATVTTAVGLRQNVPIHRNMVRRAQRMRNRLRALVRHPRVRRLPDEEDE